MILSLPFCSQEAQDRSEARVGGVGQAAVTESSGQNHVAVIAGNTQQGDRFLQAVKAKKGGRMNLKSARDERKLHGNGRRKGGLLAGGRVADGAATLFIARSLQPSVYV